ncbi:hypothetical protein S1OALGB6SA_2399 [Olavius algarvensis spirochete endosymbiont]|nr:hypothetical protein S1OALGB6SA_2399 [Olavius algarvensis spirochete endosymbiont]
MWILHLSNTSKPNLIIELISRFEYSSQETSDGQSREIPWLGILMLI